MTPRDHSSHSAAKPPQKSGQMNPQMLVFGGNKGGIGRSVISTLTSLSLAELGYQTLLIDLHLGSSNLHTLLGVMKVPHNFERWVLDPKVGFESMCCETSHARLSLVSSAGSVLSVGDLSPERLKQLIRDALNMEVDYVVVDLGSSLHPHNLDLLNMASQSFCITTPDPLSIQNTYALYKAVLMRRMETSLNERPWLRKILKRVAITQDGERSTPMGEMLGMLRELDMDVHREANSQLNSLRLTLIINQARPDDEGQVVGTLSKICQRSLALSLTHTLTLLDEPKVRSFVRKLKSLSELDPDLSIRAQIHKWVAQWLVTQPYAALQESALDRVGSPSLLGVQVKDHTRSTPQAQSSLTYSSDSTLLGAPQLFLTPNSPPLASVSKHLERGSNDVDQAHNILEQMSYPEAKDLAEMRRLVSAQQGTLQGSHPLVEQSSFDPSSHEVSQVMTSGEYGEDTVYDSQSSSFIEPEPIGAIMMEDPPPHEVTAIEEEVKTPSGWCHLKTSDLAPFRPAIQTSVYQDGHRKVFYEESYEGIYQPNTGTEIEKRVERIHHESAQVLQEGGVEAWCKAHNYPIPAEQGSSYFPLVSHEHEGYFDPK